MFPQEMPVQQFLADCRCLLAAIILVRKAIFAISSRTRLFSTAFSGSFAPGERRVAGHQDPREIHAVPALQGFPQSPGRCWPHSPPRSQRLSTAGYRGSRRSNNPHGSYRNREWPGTLVPTPSPRGMGMGHPADLREMLVEFQVRRGVGGRFEIAFHHPAAGIHHHHFFHG